MCAQERLVSQATSVCNEQSRSSRLLQLYPEVVSHLLKKYVTNQAIYEYDVTILLYVQPANMALQQIADNLIAKSNNVSLVQDKNMIKDVFKGGVDASTRHSLHNCCLKKPHAAWIDFAF